MAIERDALYDDAMIHAICDGNIVLCDSLRRRGADVSLMVRFGAMAGRAEMCEKAREWGICDPNEMMRYAALAGNEDIIVLAREWGATDYNGMLISAAEGGHAHICERARELGATDVTEALIRAAEHDHVNIVRLLLKRGHECDAVFGLAKGNYLTRCRELGFGYEEDYMRSYSWYALAGAAASGNVALCEHIYDYISNHGGFGIAEARQNCLNQMLLAATKYNQSKTCSLARHWNAQDVEGMLRVASKHGYTSLCRMARDWGARDFDGMRAIAEEFNRPAVRALAIEWGAIIA